VQAQEYEELKPEAGGKQGERHHPGGHHEKAPAQLTTLENKD
jgi:hypothetical protein